MRTRLGSAGRSILQAGAAEGIIAEAAVEVDLPSRQENCLAKRLGTSSTRRVTCDAPAPRAWGGPSRRPRCVAVPRGKLRSRGCDRSASREIDGLSVIQPDKAIDGYLEPPSSAYR